MPTIHGDKVVIRIFRRDDCALDLEALGLNTIVIQDLKRFVRERQGVLLFTGPSGSGKTTTIYALLEEIHHQAEGEINIVTLEDPVERDLGFAAQTDLGSCRNMSLAEAFRNILRQDPEVIVVGEIRDPLTAQIAVRAGLTGHLVISTIHTRDTFEVFPRLLEMGVEGYLVACSVVGVVAQRLVRKLCPSCKLPTEMSFLLQEKLGIQPHTQLYASQGCPACRMTGYHGRIAISECLPVNEELRVQILAHRDLGSLRHCSEKHLSLSLIQSAVSLLETGLTSPKEVFRVLPRLGETVLEENL
jgi:type II secretory ATPase GspE/PulE/Tfp pilus assembly ATPase PilB-like protein